MVRNRHRKRGGGLCFEVTRAPVVRVVVVVSTVRVALLARQLLVEARRGMRRVLHHHDVPLRGRGSQSGKGRQKQVDKGYSDTLHQRSAFPA